MYEVTLVNPKSEILKPDEALWEFHGLRTRTSKTFRLKSGLNRQIITIGHQHYWDGQWKDIDNTITAWNSNMFEVTKASYFWRSTEQGIGCHYKSRLGGYCRLRLLSTDKPINWVEKPTPDGNNLKYFKIAKDTDFHWQLLPSQCKGWVTLYSDLAPRSWKWEFIHKGNVRIARTQRGWDALKRPVQLKIKSRTTKLKNGLKRTILEKTWTGLVYEKDKNRGRKLVDPVYPVVIDPDISEEITATNDDGTEYAMMPDWYNSYVTLGFSSAAFYQRQPGFRFQGAGIENGMTIDLANFKIYQSSYYSSGGVGTIYGGTAAAVPWDGSNLPSTITKTTASTSWPAAAVSMTQQTFAVTSIVQEIADVPSWTTGNNLALCGISSSTQYNASYFSVYPDSGKHGRLEIDYTAGAGGSYVFLGPSRFNIFDTTVIGKN